MKKILTTAFLGTFILSSYVQAGNEDRVGSAGASQLLINPWARSTASADAGFANTVGLEAQYTNIAGLALADKTQIKFNMSKWLGKADINFYSAGFAQRISESSVFAISIQSMNFGEIDVTTVALPEGQIGVFTPRVNVFNVGYAKKFSSSISGGINFKVISESIDNLKANGVAIDAGIRYVTGEKDQIKFGIALKNVGPTMKYKGDGLARQINYVSSDAFVATMEQRSQQFEMPSLLNIGASYDFIFSESSKLVGMFGFTANSFSTDQYRLGFDYNLTKEKAAFNIRVGYVYEKNLFSVENRTSALTGLTAGFSVDVLSGKNKSPLGIEYAMRMAGPFGYIHTAGITIAIK
ncbi:MAG: PorV/PorQ family protein [Bacteroidota bacterium]